MTDSKDIRIGDSTYRLRPWSYQDGRAWLHRLVQMIASTLAGANPDEAAAAVGAGVKSIDAQMFVELCDVVERYTDVVSMKDGKVAVVPLSKVATQYMRGRHFELVALIKAHLEAEYADFFGRVGELLPGGARTVEESH